MLLSRRQGHLLSALLKGSEHVISPIGGWISHTELCCSQEGT